MEPQAAIAEVPHLATLFSLEKLLTEWNILLIVAVWMLIQTARRALPDYLADGKPLARLVPVMPVAGCLVAVFIPGPWVDPGEPLGQRVVLGVVLGALTANFHSIASKLGLHGVLRIEADPEKRTEQEVRRIMKRKPNRERDETQKILVDHTPAETTSPKENA